MCKNGNLKKDYLLLHFSCNWKFTPASRLYFRQASTAGPESFFNYFLKVQLLGPKMYEPNMTELQMLENRFCKDVSKI